MMRTTSLVIAAAVAVVLASSVLAQETTPAAAEKDAPVTSAVNAPPAAITVTGGATLTTDYRFRGLSQTNKTVAVQATATVALRSGFYASFWGSTIDDYIANGSDAELDLIAGYKRSFHGTAIDGGVLYYVYPQNNGADTDFFEPYINASHTYGPIGAKIGGNFAWKQRRLAVDGRKHAGAYGFAELSAPIPTTPVTITGHLGHSFERNYITFDEIYTDWSVTAAVTRQAITLSVAYVDTDKTLFSYPAGGGTNRNVAKSGIVGAIAFNF